MGLECTSARLVFLISTVIESYARTQTCNQLEIPFYETNISYNVGKQSNSHCFQSSLFPLIVLPDVRIPRKDAGVLLLRVLLVPVVFDRHKCLNKDVGRLERSAPLEAANFNSRSDQIDLLRRGGNHGLESS
jgi:hypothetical protein